MRIFAQAFWEAGLCTALPEQTLLPKPNLLLAPADRRITCLFLNETPGVTYCRNQFCFAVSFKTEEMKALPVSLPMAGVSHFVETTLLMEPDKLPKAAST